MVHPAQITGSILKLGDVVIIQDESPDTEAWVQAEVISAMFDEIRHCWFYKAKTGSGSWAGFFDTDVWTLERPGLNVVKYVKAERLPAFTIHNDTNKEVEIHMDISELAIRIDKMAKENAMTDGGGCPVHKDKDCPRYYREG